MGMTLSAEDQCRLASCFTDEDDSCCGDDDSSVVPAATESDRLQPSLVFIQKSGCDLHGLSLKPANLRRARTFFSIAFSLMDQSVSPPDSELEAFIAIIKFLSGVFQAAKLNLSPDECYVLLGLLQLNASHQAVDEQNLTAFLTDPGRLAANQRRVLDQQAVAAINDALYDKKCIDIADGKIQLTEGIRTRVQLS